MKSTGRDRAVVVGAGIAGLAASGALSARYGEVWVLDRDAFSDVPFDRPFLPQGPFAHVMLARGQRLLDGWFPELAGELDRLGAPSLDWGADTAVFHRGDWMPRFDSGLRVRPSTRAALEVALRRSLARRPGVTFRDRTRAVGPLLHSGRVAGVRAAPEDPDRPPGDDPTTTEAIEADLVVDATGRAGHTGAWLRQVGLPEPASTLVRPKTSYARRVYEVPPGDRGWRCLYLMPQGPSLPRGGLVYPVEGGRWVVNLHAYDGAEAPDEAAFAAFAASLARPDLADALRSARPVSGVARFRGAVDRRVRYEAVSGWPEGFVSVGDASCTLNPVYGQGMTLAALGVLALEAELDRPGGFSAGRFQRRLSRVQREAFWMSTLEDLRWPSTTGRGRDVFVRAALAVTDRVHTAAQRDLEVYRVLADVIHLVRPPTALLQPRLALRVWRRPPSSLPSPRAAAA